MGSGILDPAIVIRLVGLDDTFSLRKAVLRPRLTPESSRAAFAGTPERFHVAALTEGRVISTASFTIESHERLDDLHGAAARWRLRAMATDPAFRSRGLGGRVLRFGIAELTHRLAERGEAAALVWCSGRSAAQGFYQRHGFAPIGAVVEHSDTGPHLVFWQRVEAAQNTAR